MPSIGDVDGKHFLVKITEPGMDPLGHKVQQTLPTVRTLPSVTEVALQTLHVDSFLATDQGGQPPFLL